MADICVSNHRVAAYTLYPFRWLAFIKRQIQMEGKKGFLRTNFSSKKTAYNYNTRFSIKIFFEFGWLAPFLLVRIIKLFLNVLNRHCLCADWLPFLQKSNHEYQSCLSSHHQTFVKMNLRKPRGIVSP